MVTKESGRSSEMIKRFKKGYEYLRKKNANESRYRELIVFPLISEILGFFPGDGILEVEFPDKEGRYDYYLKNYSCAVQVKTEKTFIKGEPDIWRYFKQNKKTVKHGIVTDGLRWHIYSEKYSQPKQGKRNINKYRIFKIRLTSTESLAVLRCLLNAQEPKIAEVFKDAATIKRIQQGKTNVSFRSYFEDKAEIAKFFINEVLGELKTTDTGQLLDLLDKGKIKTGDIIEATGLFNRRFSDITPRFKVLDNGQFELVSLQVELGSEIERIIAENEVEKGKVYGSFASFLTDVGKPPKQRDMMRLWEIRGNSLKEIENRRRKSAG